jgi:hypothetical protein
LKREKKEVKLNEERVKALFGFGLIEVEVKRRRNKMIISADIYTLTMLCE